MFKDFINKIAILEHMDDIFIWLFKLVLILALTLFLGYVQRKIFNRVLNRLQQTHNIWDDAIFYALEKPLNILIWLLGFTFVSQIIQSEHQDGAFFHWLSKFRAVGIIILITWSVFRLLERLEMNITSNDKPDYDPMDKTTANAISRLLKIIVSVALGLVALETLDIKTTGVLALGGAGTFVIGMASKDVVANFLGGAVIYLDRPFSVGDWICSPDRDIEGDVEYIGWRSTRIRRFNQRALYVPNSTFNTIALENPSRMNNRAIKETLCLNYEDASQIPLVTKAMEEMIKNYPDIDNKRTTFVKLTKMDEYSLTLLIYCFTKTTAWVPYLEVQQKIFLKLVNIIEEHGLQIAYKRINVSNDKE